jgi:ceramide glucosyltransferase
MEYVLLALAVVALCSHVMAGTSVWRAMRRAPRPARGSAWPRVSVLKPLRGLDDQLEQNLESYFALDYPRFDIVFCAADASDPALAVARRVKARHPDVSCRIVVGEVSAGLNPKVKVLAHATPFTRGELILVSDSNVRVRPSYLRETVNAMEDPEVAVVSNLVAGVDERSLGATLENLQLNGFIAPAICMGMMLRALPCVVGKSMLIRRTDLDAIGGWEVLADVLAEDYVLGRKLARRKRRAIICPHVVETVNEHWSLGRFLERHDRWLKMRWRINAAALVYELVANVTLWTLSWVMCAGPTPAVLTGAAALLAGRIGIEAFESRLLRRGRRMAWFRFALVPVRDLVLALLWAHARISRTVRWRQGTTFVLGPESALILPEAARSPARVPEPEPATLAPAGSIPAVAGSVPPARPPFDRLAPPGPESISSQPHR